MWHEMSSDLRCWMAGLSPKNAKVKAEYIVDGVHPNPIGHELIGASLARMLNAI